MMTYNVRLENALPSSRTSAGPSVVSKLWIDFGAKFAGPLRDASYGPDLVHKLRAQFGTHIVVWGGDMGGTTTTPPQHQRGFPRDPGRHLTSHLNKLSFPTPGKAGGSLYKQRNIITPQDFGGTNFMHKWGRGPWGSCVGIIGKFPGQA